MNIPTKAEVKQRLGLRFDADLARLFGISQAAIHKWAEDAPIPENRWLRLRYELRPDVFGESADSAAREVGDAA